MCQTMRGCAAGGLRSSAIAMSRSRLMPGKERRSRGLQHARLRVESSRTATVRKLSITVLASSLRAISSASAARALGVGLGQLELDHLAGAHLAHAARSRDRASAWPIALPCGSSTPGFSMTVTTAFTASAPAP